MLTYFVAALLLANGQAQQPNQVQTGRPGIGGAQGQGMASLDGQWTVVCAEKNGQKIDHINHKTVQIRGNTVTFYDPQNKEMQVRLEFGPHETVRCYGLHQVQGGKTGATGGGIREPGAAGQGTAGQGGIGQGAAGQGGIAGKQQFHTGVYVLTKDYLCIAMDNLAGGAGGIGRPGSGGAGNPGTAGIGGAPTGADRTIGQGPGGKTGKELQGTGGTTQTGGLGQGGAGNLGMGGRPHMSPFAVILRRASSTGGTTGRESR